MSKSYDNAKELEYINFDSTNNKINFSVAISTNGSAVAASVYDANSTSNGAFSIPTGNTASRPANPQLGSIRFNTTNSAGEIYTANGWIEFAARSPSVSNVSPTVFSGASGTTFSIYGLNFTQDAQVYFLLANNFPVLSSSVSYVNSSLLQATTPRIFTVAEETLGVRVVQNSGSAAILSAIDCGSVPTWNTSSGTVATYSFSNSSNLVVSTYQFDAYDPDNTSVSYTLSGTLPLNLSLQSNGAITGTVTVPTTSSVTNNFSVIVSDAAGNQTTRAFSIVRRWLDGSTSALAAPSANAIKTLTGTTSSGLYYLKPSSWTYPGQFYCEMSRAGGGWIILAQQQIVNNAGLSNSLLTGSSGTPNQNVSNFWGVTDTNSTSKSISDIWDGFIGTSTAARIYCREIQTSGGTYDEHQYYVSNSDTPIFTKSIFNSMFTGNFTGGSGSSSQLYNQIKVYYNNASSNVTSKSLAQWSGPGVLLTINNSNIDQELYFCNGPGSDSNWSFALMKGGTPYPRLADAANGGGRNSITRWAIIGIKD